MCMSPGSETSVGTLEKGVLFLQLWLVQAMKLKLLIEIRPPPNNDEANTVASKARDGEEVLASLQVYQLSELI